MTRAMLTLASTRDATLRLPPCQHFFCPPPPTPHLSVICHLAHIRLCYICHSGYTPTTGCFMLAHEYMAINCSRNCPKKLTSSTLSIYIFHCPKVRLSFKQALHMQRHTYIQEWSGCAGLSENSWSMGCRRRRRKALQFSAEYQLDILSPSAIAPAPELPPALRTPQTPQNPKSPAWTWREPKQS